MPRCLHLLGLLIFPLAAALSFQLQAQVRVDARPLPFDGGRAKAAVDGNGTVQLLFHRQGNAYYASKKPAEKEFAPPIRVNSIEGSAAVSELAIGADQRVHVLFHGNIFYIREQLENKERRLRPQDVRYTFYSRMNDAGTGFENQLEISPGVWGFDGGCTIAADQEGNVYAFFAGSKESAKETDREVFMARSSDHGRTFSQPHPIGLGKGVCACCHLKATMDREGRLYLAYRIAENGIQRDSYVLTSQDQGETWGATPLDEWQLRACPGSVYSFASTQGGNYVSLRNKEQVFFADLFPENPELIAPPESSRKRRAAVMAGDSQGHLLLAWAEGENFNKPHDLVWQLFEENGKPLGKVERLNNAFERWGNAAVYAEPEGNFVILY